MISTVFVDWVSGAGGFVVPLMKAVGLGIPVPTAPGTEIIVLGGWICEERLLRLSDRTSSLRPREVGFGTGGSCLVGTFGIFGADSLGSIGASIRDGVFSLRLVVEQILLVEPKSLDFDLAATGMESSDFLPRDCCWFWWFNIFCCCCCCCEGGCCSLRLMLESLRSLRADENPLLELVRFEVCVFVEDRSDLSCLKSFSLSSMECFVPDVGVALLVL